MAISTLNLVNAEQRETVSSVMVYDPDRHSLRDFRDLMEGFGAILTPEPVDYDLKSAPGPAGATDVQVLIHRPDEQHAPSPAILYLHGGGMVAGSAEMMAGAHRKLAQQTGAVVVAPNYRLAPEAPFPAGLEDCYATLLWLHAQAGELGIDSNRISVMGDSGGGGLAAAVSLLARDRKAVPIRAQILLYPMLDVRTATAAAPSDDPATGEFIVNRALTRMCWNHVRGDALIAKEQMSYLSPALAPDLQSLPPAVIMTGSLDLFRDENLTYATRLLQAKVPTDLFVYAGAVHGFDMLPGQLAVDASSNLIASVRRLI